MNQLINRYKELAKKADVTRGTPESAEWFRRRIRKDPSIRTYDRVTDGLQTRGRIIPGGMYTYFYDPKYKEKLPYYDNHPLVIILDQAEGGWYGANLHYLPPSLRLELLMDLGFGKSFKNVNLQQVRRKLENSDLTRPCIRRYLSRQVRGNLYGVPKTEWEIVIQMPFEAFVKESSRSIWRKSRSKI